MKGWIEMLNHLLQMALAEQGGGGAFTLRGLHLEPDGGRVLARLDHPLAHGEVVLRLTVLPTQGSQFTLGLVVEQAPPDLGPALDPFRKVLEKMRIQIELDFS